MIVKSGSALLLMCILAVLYGRCVSLPHFDVSLLDVPAELVPSEGENITAGQDHHQLYEESGTSLRAAVCPGHQWTIDVKCTDNDGVYVSIGHCLTYEKGKGVFIFKCPYFQLEGHKVSDSKSGYIKLPDNISELNDYMCGPMNRKGFLCEECIEDFSVSMTSIGSKCSNCTDAWYGIPLYLITELVPVTAFYLLILVFQIHITSAPMTSFILYSQMVMFVLIIDPPDPLVKVVPQYERSFLFKLNILLYGPWNLDLLRYVLPPFCVINGLDFKYAAVLGYVSVLYPLFLIFLTWVCIELYGRRFRPIIYILVPFRKCLRMLKQDWGKKRDVVDVFLAFFLLSYSRLMYQSSLFLECSKVTRLHHRHSGLKYILDYDSNITCPSSKYTAIAIAAALILFIFNILPALLIVLYPFKIVRSCLSKCRLDTLCLSAFMDKFYGCYRDGLSRERDMRSFAGAYFLLRFLPFLYYPCKLYKVHLSFGSYLVLIFLTAILLIAIARPYKENYMNIFDILLLGYVAFMSKMITDDYFKDMGTRLFIMSLVPAFALGICLFYVKILKAYSFRFCRRCTSYGNGATQIEDDTVNSVLENLDREGVGVAQPLLNHTSDSAAIGHNFRIYESTD